MAKVKAKTLTCPNCSSPVPVRNIMKAKTVVCRNCDSQIDVTKPNIEVMAQLRKQYDSPIGIVPGMKGTLPDGLTCEVVGRVRYEDSDIEDIWTWDEWLLLDQKGRYRWLQEDEGKFSLLTRFDPDDPPSLMSIKASDWVELDGARYRINERGNPRIVALQGELTWRATVGDRISYVDARAGNKNLAVEWTDEEIEFFQSERITRLQALTTCGLDALIALDQERYSMLKEAGAGAKSAGCAGMIAGGGAGAAFLGFLASATTMYSVSKNTHAVITTDEVLQGFELAHFDLRAGEQYTARLSVSKFHPNLQKAQVEIETPITGSFPLWSITNPITQTGRLSMDRSFVADSSGTHKLILKGEGLAGTTALENVKVDVTGDGLDATGLFCIAPMLLGGAVLLFMLSATRKARAASKVASEMRKRRATIINELHEAATVQE